MLDHRTDTFLCVCETMSYTRAARQLNMTQPAVSQHIKYLEELYGVQLFRYEKKQLILVDHNEKRAYEFMNCNEYLQTVGSDDILWSSLTGVSEEALNRARGLFAHYPTFIRKFQNGVAEVSWQINPDGQYFMDEDGFGMTDDKEIEIYGFIDRRGKVLVKFQMIKTSDDLKRMRKEAEELIL